MILQVNYNEYFDKLLNFLEEYRWLVDFAVTDILVADVFSKIPPDWSSYFQDMTFEDTIDLAHERFNHDCPESLVTFFEQCNLLKLDSIIEILKNDWPKVDIESKLRRGLSIKKQCEVESLSGLVDLVCKQSTCEGVIDMGSGLGYVDRLLASKGYKVLGIESNELLVQKANKQINKISPLLSERIAYCSLTINEDSFFPLLKTVEEFTNEKFIKNKLCMIGLHTCGDLASSALRMFLNIPSINTAVILPCCYHKLNVIDYDRYEAYETCTELVHTNFKNFPLSKTLSRAFHKPEYKNLFFRPFLRLASQENYYRWKGWTKFDHQTNAFNVMSRAVLQYYVNKEGLQLKKCYRRLLNKNVYSDFSSFLKSVLDCCNFTEVHSSDILNSNEEHNKISNALLDLWNRFKCYLVLTEIVLILQMAMQSLVEAFIIMDFLSFLKESNVTNLKVAKLCDSNISPRNFVIIASKTNF